MGSQRFCLRWNNHQTNLLSVFDQLLQDEAFVDVTLAVDGQFLKAHKMVLSACSPYFQALFVGHPDKHPIVILKDVPFSDMRSLLDFMYRGEVSVDQDRLTAFLKVAESLRIKGLTEVNDERCDLPSIANSLLNSPPPLKPPPPPPPPNLHRIPPQGMQMNMPHQSPNSPHHMGSNQLHSSKRPFPHQQQQHPTFAAFLDSTLCGPKRKRGRPRKLSGSSPGPNMEREDSRMNNVDNHMSVMMGEHLVVKAVAPGTALSKQLTILNAHHPSSPHHSNVERCSPHPMLTPGEQGSVGSPAVTPRRTESSEPVSPANATPATDIDDVEEEAIDEDEDGIAGDQGSPEPEHQNETDEFNNQPFKSEGDPKPSTSGHENSSPYRQQQNQPSNQQQNSTDSPTNQFPSSVDVKDEPLDESEQSQDSDLTPGDYEDMIACSPASSDCDDEVFEANEESKAKLAAEAGDSPSKPSSLPEAEIIDDDITQIEQDSFSSLMNPSVKTASLRSANSAGRSRRLDKLSIRRYCTREGNHMYRCNVCSKTYTHISNFCRHFLSAHCGYKQDIQCPVCLKAFTRKDNMMTHAKQVHGVSVGKGGATAATAGDTAEQRNDATQ